MITEVIATYAAVVGTIGIYLDIKRFKREKTDIRVTVKLVEKVGKRGTLDIDRGVIIEGVNKGRRPTTVVEAGFELNNGKDIVLDENSADMKDLPKLMREGVVCRVIAYRLDLERKMIEEESEIKKGWLKDAEGKMWNCDFKLSV